MATPARAIRVSDELWQAAVAKAADEGTSVTAIVVQRLREFVEGAG